jgi:hypothetical protein
MKNLIDNLITILEAAITAGTLSATTVFKGLQNAPMQAGYSEFPYIMIDDGGEVSDEVDPSTTRANNRTYNVVLEIGCYSANSITTAMDQSMDISDELKSLLYGTAIKIAGDDSDQQYEFIWGLVITPFGWEQADGYFRGRQITVGYVELEDTIDRY